MFHVLKVRLRPEMLHIFLTLASLIADSRASCVDSSGKYDLTPLNRTTPWNVSIPSVDIDSEKNGTIFYQLSICHPIVDGDCKGSEICRIDGSQVDKFNEETEIAMGNDGSGFWFTYAGGKCKTDGQLKMAINFQCGDKLGSPKFTHSSGCTTYFMWRTSAACTRKTTRKQVPCYVLDENGLRRDLSKLTLKTGGYEVMTMAPIKFVINVCDEIVEDSTSPKCPAGSGACRQIGSEFISFGHPVTPLQVDEDGNLFLEYGLDNETNPKIPGGCNQPPSTRITFKCPREKSSKDSYTRHQGPILSMSAECQYAIEWTTEYACPIKELDSSSACLLAEPELGIDVNLTPFFRSSGESPYHARATVNNKTMDFYVNICGEVSNKVCDGSSSACVKSPESQTISLGSSMMKQLRFIDGDVSLLYTNGDMCSTDSSEKLSTVFNFKCNTSAGIGEPTFNQLVGCTYFFNWQSKKVCPELAEGAKCRAQSGSKVIDLSSLVENRGSQGWLAFTSGVEEFATSDVVINICGALRISSRFKGCSEGSAVCLRKKDGTVLNLGRFEKEPQFVGNNAQLMYVNGDVCPKNNSKTISSEIQFICTPGELHSGPSLTDVSDDECFFRFQWQTAFACVQAQHTGDQCRVHDDELDLDFDLSPLKKNGTVKITSGDYDYFISVCGEANEQLCSSLEKHAICQVKKSNTSAVWNLGSPTDDLVYYNGFINLTYTNGTKYSNGNPRQSTIAFLCDPDAGLGHPEFVNEVNQNYAFKWYTSLTCTEKQMECTVFDEKNHHQYDLSRLTRQPGKSDWEMTANITGTQKKFYFNVCRPLVGSVTGCDTEASSCIVDLVDGKEKVSVKNAGRPTKPIVDGRGLITLRYTSDEPCTEGSLKRMYTTTIHLMCYNSTVAKSPEYFQTLNSCEYIFLWETPAACSLQSTTKTGGCQIEDPSTHDLIDLKSLKGIYSTDLVNLSLCGADLDCGGVNHNAAVCAYGPSGDEKVIGLADNSHLSISKSGEVVIEYDGDYNSETGKPKSTVKLTLRCDPNVDHGPLALVDEIENVYYFEMSTKVVCGSSSSAFQCSAMDRKGNVYDLSSLALPNDNWEIGDVRADHLDLRYFINFCRPLVPTPFTSGNCFDGVSAACQFGGSGLSYSLGRIDGRPHVVSDGQLTVRYTNGSPCHDGKFQRSMRVNLECSKVQKDPVFVEETAECEYIVSWSTPAACPLQQSIGKDCQVQDSRFGYQFDLSPLKSTGPYNVSGDGREYMISVCGSVNCGSSNDVGVCQMSKEKAISAGRFNGEVMFDDGELTLTYTDGEANCHGKYSRTSVIRFVCGEANPGQPIFLSESSNCTYLFLWSTALACAPITTSQCSVRSKDGHFFDLSPLTLSEGSHVLVRGDGTEKFLINVCKSIGQSKDSRCQYTSGVCKVDLKETDPKRRFSNVGSVHRGPYFEDGLLKLKYSFGESCDNGSSEAVIIFLCDKLKRDSVPRLLMKLNCVWHFSWATAYACAVEDEVVSENCMATNPDTGFMFDLNSLSRPEGYSFVGPRGEHKYSINVCGNLTGNACGDNAGSCQEEKNGARKWTGGVGNSRLHYHNGVLFLNYSNGESCHEGQFQRSTIISFVCGSGKGEPIFVDESENCTYYVTWKTELACEKQVHCVVDNGSNIIDLSPLMGPTHFVASDKLSTQKVYFLSICRPLNPVAGFPCPPEAAACLTGVGIQNPLSLGQISTPPGLDEEGHVSISYSDGSQCPINSSLTVSSRIIFLCDQRSGIGAPEFVDSNDDCEYVFKWQTNIVCPGTISPPPHEITGDGCVFTDEKTWQTFDLRSLAAKSIEVGETSFSICGSVAPTGLCAGASICQQSNISLGLATSMRPVINRNELRLVFNGSSDCPQDATRKWSSEIRFTCDRKAGIVAPVVIDIIGCTVYYEWKTSSVCPAVCEIQGRGGGLMDLRSLAAMSHAWTAIDTNGNAYWLNICEGFKKGWKLPVVCSRDTTVCRISTDGEAEAVGSVANQRLSLKDGTDEPLLEYSGPASSDQDRCTPKVQIRFVCAETLGDPLFVADSVTDGCRLIVFEWRTSAACVQRRRRLEMDWKNGIVYDARENLSLDFSKLMAKSFIANEQRGNDQYTYIIAMHTQDACGERGVCQTKRNGFKRIVGLDENANMYRTDNRILLELASNSPCGRNAKKNMTSVITFDCDLNAGVGQPVFVYESHECNYNFDWRTEVVCSEKMSVGVHSHSESSKHSGGSSVGAIFAIVGSLLAVIVIVAFIVSSPTRRAVISQKFRQLWRRTRSTPSFHYSRLPTDNSERTFLLQGGGVGGGDSQILALPDSDDDDDDILEL